MTHVGTEEEKVEEVTTTIETIRIVTTTKGEARRQSWKFESNMPPLAMNGGKKKNKQRKRSQMKKRNSHMEIPRIS